jgi:hypothetical protein
MKTSHVVVLALVILSIHASVEVRLEDDIESLSRSLDDVISATRESDPRTVSVESAFEYLLPQSPILSFPDLAQHVVAHSRQALGFEAVVSDEDLTNLAWYFRLRHMPEPLVVAERSTLGDASRLVRHILTNERVRNSHHFSEAKIKELIEAVDRSTQTDRGFVFRIIEGADEEYGLLHLHQHPARQHYFASVHNSTDLLVAYVGSEVQGEYIKGHGGPDAVSERAVGDRFLRQWLLNQWVNLWICTNHAGAN